VNEHLTTENGMCLVTAQAHRMLHFRVLYRFVHSLHHRNVDPEPFSGLCMHPVEHLYYLATVLPSVVLTLSPFHFLWNGMHAVISPAAGHSGWEDHWQSDQFHYIHHAKFECNYGGGGIPVDAWFGTLRDTLSGTDRLYKVRHSTIALALARLMTCCWPTDPTVTRPVRRRLVFCRAPPLAV
jgi:sterol desaturase/sphingolipid hydroxylase (fatty acid hydroxylase superfamily)